MDVVAERHLELRTDDGRTDVVVLLGTPKQVAPEEWTCEFQVRIGGKGKIRTIHGGDSLQALQLAMASIDVEIGVRTEGLGTLYHLGEPFSSVLENSGMQPRNSRPNVT